MADDAIPAEELATWLRPSDALRTVQRSFPDVRVAGRVILDRLTGGLIRAGAKSSSWGEGGKPTPPVLIPASYWLKISGQQPEWWNTGGIRFFFAGNQYRSSTTGRFFGIRLDPKGIDEILEESPPPSSPPPAPQEPMPQRNDRTSWLRPASHEQPPPPRSPTSSEDAVERYGYRGASEILTAYPQAARSESPKAPISPATLKAWWVMCQTLKAADAWTIEEMRAFYDRCFPDKFLSRDRLRELRPNSKSGPKPKAAE